MDKYKIGLQLYTIREEMEKDLEGCLKRISAQGYEGVELAGTYGRTAEEWKKLLAGNGLIPVSAHVPLEELAADTGACLAYYRELGCEKIVLPYLTEENRYGSEQYEAVLEQMEWYGKSCAEIGMTFAYHNHDFEFAKTDRDQYVLDELYDRIPAAFLNAELDVCWIAVAGEDPADYLRRYRNRCELLHIKDFKREDNNVILTPAGKGCVSMESVLDTAAECGIKWLIVEQDAHYGADPFENTGISLEYIRNYEKERA